MKRRARGAAVMSVIVTHLHLHTCTHAAYSCRRDCRAGPARWLPGAPRLAEKPAQGPL